METEKFSFMFSPEINNNPYSTEVAWTTGCPNTADQNMAGDFKVLVSMFLKPGGRFPNKNKTNK